MPRDAADMFPNSKEEAISLNQVEAEGRGGLSFYFGFWTKERGSQVVICIHCDEEINLVDGGLRDYLDDFENHYMKKHTELFALLCLQGRNRLTWL